jgi:hypothetical protein
LGTCNLGWNCCTILFNIMMYIDIAVTGIPADIPALLGSKLVGEEVEHYLWVILRTAAYTVAVGRIAEALSARGWIKDWCMPFKC